MKTFVNYINSLLFPLLPESRCFRLKVIMLRVAGAKIGRNVNVCSSVKIIGTGELEIGDNVWIGHQVLIITTSKITLGSNIDIAPRVYIGTGTHIIDPKGPHSAGIGVNKDVIIENGVWLCTNAIILPGVTVGEKSVIAAGAVVNKSVPAKCYHGGVPANFIKAI